MTLFISNPFGVQSQLKNETQTREEVAGPVLFIEGPVPGRGTGDLGSVQPALETGPELRYTAVIVFMKEVKILTLGPCGEPGLGAPW